MEAAGVRVERLELEGRPHGLGYTENWFDAFDNFLTDVFAIVNKQSGGKKDGACYIKQWSKDANPWIWRISGHERRM